MALPGQTAPAEGVETGQDGIGTESDGAERGLVDGERARDQVRTTSTGFAQRAAQVAFVLVMALVTGITGWVLWPGGDGGSPAPQRSRALNPGAPVSFDLPVPVLAAARPAPSEPVETPIAAPAREKPATRPLPPPIAVRRAPPAGSNPAAARPGESESRPAPPAPPQPPPEPEPPLVRTAGLMSGPIGGNAAAGPLGAADAAGAAGGAGAEVVDSLFGADAPGAGGVAGVAGTGGVGDRYATSTRDAAVATILANPSLTIRKSTAIECALRQRIKTEIPGEVSCQVTRDVYSLDLRTRLIEAGSIVHGEYAGLSGERVGIVWTRLDTPNHKTISLGSPATDPLGAAGIEARVDYRFLRRFGAAIMVSIVSDTLEAASQSLSEQRGEEQVQFGANTVDATALIVQSMLQTYANIPITGSVNQGDRVVVFLARDLDFSSVYDVRPR